MFHSESKVIYIQGSMRASTPIPSTRQIRVERIILIVFDAVFLLATVLLAYIKSLRIGVVALLFVVLFTFVRIAKMRQQDAVSVTLRSNLLFIAAL